MLNPPQHGHYSNQNHRTQHHRINHEMIYECAHPYHYHHL
ncbi:hypothetical protein LSH36_189g03053 [Paralvinella palmiformis]|uniref:Uncharacterized protein n=1 Tax=Paralvinella palmiformis TaxID=53620 RepID=A0AAD9JQH9_9ANNE|nr:hypothetical protein LSH36_189g03053 [Paralvinella palmiformis]